MNHPFRILLIGNTGQLGWELERCLSPLGDVTAIDFPSIDLADIDGTRKFVRKNQPGLVINATAYTAVDKAESEPALAEAINATAPGVLADEARCMGAAFLHYSTDYVFDGTKGSTYVEHDLPNPLNTYGRTKLAGEQAVQQVGGAYLILRTSWVYSLRRDSFVTKVLSWARTRSTLKLVTDQVSGPTWARMLAQATSLLVLRGMPDLNSWFSEYKGLYHLAGSGYCSRYEWAEQVIKLDPHKNEHKVKELIPAITTEFPTPATRPLFSALNCDLFTQTFHLSLPDWQSALKLAMEAT